MPNIEQQFVDFVVKSLVNSPDAVEVARSVDEKGVLLELTVDPEDLGRVIGKHGATAQALRTLLRALGTKNEARYNLKIVDNDADTSPPSAGSRADTDTDDGTDDGVGKTDDDISPAKKSAAAPPADEAASKPASDGYDQTRRELEDLDDLDV